MQKFDIIVIGSGPAGQRAAIQGAKCGRRVAVIEQREIIGGACVNTGTIPSKTMREWAARRTIAASHSAFASRFNGRTAPFRAIAYNRAAAICEEFHSLLG